MSSQFAFTEADQEDLINKHSHDLTIQLPDGNTIVPWVPVDAGIITLKKGTELFPINSYNKFQEMRAGLQQLMNADPETITLEERVIIAQQIAPALDEIERANQIGIFCGIRPEFVKPFKEQLELIFTPDRKIEMVRCINPNNISYFFKNFDFKQLRLTNSIPYSEAASTLLITSENNIPQFRTQAMQLLKPHMRALQELSSVFLYKPQDVSLMLSDERFIGLVSIIKTMNQSPKLREELGNAFAISCKRLTRQDGFCPNISSDLEVLPTKIEA